MEKIKGYLEPDRQSPDQIPYSQIYKFLSHSNLLKESIGKPHFK